MTSRRLLFLILALSLSFAAPAGLVRAEDEPAMDDEVKPEKKPAKKKKSKKKKSYDYSRSKYKSLQPSQTKNYKFNEKGEPIKAKSKKKASKKKKRAEPPEVWIKERAESCGFAEECAEKKTEADTL